MLILANRGKVKTHLSRTDTGSYTYGDANQVHAVTSVSSIPNQYAAYDAMGNMTCRNTATGTGHTCAGSTPNGAALSYDSRGQLASWTAPSGKVGSAQYLYDNQGNRVLTHATGASGTTDTIDFDGYTETVIAGAIVTTTKYYNANGARVAVRVGSSSLDYLVSDPLGSNSVALNNSGQVIALQHYSPYGTVDYSWGTMPTPYSYAGERLDSQTGLLYDNFRYYDPLTGQYVRSDNVQDNAQGMNPYAYVGDNPETRNDPSGHCPWCVAVVIVGALIVVGAVAGAVGGAVSTAIQGAMENRTPSWQEYRDNMEIGAIIGGFAGLIAPLSLTPGSEIALGPLFAGIAGGTFGTGAIAGFVTGVVRHLNGEEPSQQKSPCPSGYTCTPNTPTPTAAPTPTTKTQTDNDLGLFSSALMNHSLSVLLTYDSRSFSQMSWSERSVTPFASVYSFVSVEWKRLAAWYERK